MILVRPCQQVERNKKRLSLGLKPSYFQGDPDSSDEEDAHCSIDASDASSDDEEQSDDEEEEGSDSGEGSDRDEGSRGDVKVVAAMDVSDGSSEGPLSEEEEDDEDSEEDERSSKRPRGVLEGGLGGASRGANAFSLNFGDLGTIGGAGASSDEDEETDEDSDDGREGVG